MARIDSEIILICFLFLGINILHAWPSSERQLDDVYDLAGTVPADDTPRKDVRRHVKSTGSHAGGGTGDHVLSEHHHKDMHEVQSSNQFAPGEGQKDGSDPGEDGRPYYDVAPLKRRGKGRSLVGAESESDEIARLETYNKAAAEESYKEGAGVHQQLHLHSIDSDSKGSQASVSNVEVVPKDIQVAEAVVKQVEPRVAPASEVESTQEPQPLAESTQQPVAKEESSEKPPPSVIDNAPSSNPDKPDNQDSSSTVTPEQTKDKDEANVSAKPGSGDIIASGKQDDLPSKPAESKVDNNAQTVTSSDALDATKAIAPATSVDEEIKVDVTKIEEHKVQTEEKLAPANEETATHIVAGDVPTKESPASAQTAEVVEGSNADSIVEQKQIVAHHEDAGDKTDGLGVGMAPGETIEHHEKEEVVVNQIVNHPTGDSISPGNAPAQTRERHERVAVDEGSVVQGTGHIVNGDSGVNDEVKLDLISSEQDVLSSPRLHFWKRSVRSSESDVEPMPRLRFGKRSIRSNEIDVEPMPRLRFGKRSIRSNEIDVEPMPRLRFGKRSIRSDEMEIEPMSRLRFGKRAVRRKVKRSIRTKTAVENFLENKREHSPGQPINRNLRQTEPVGLQLKFPTSFCDLERDSGVICPNLKRGLYLEQFYYDQATNRCYHFIYNGCGGNANRFSSLWECSLACGKAPNDKDQ